MPVLPGATTTGRWRRLQQWRHVAALAVIADRSAGGNFAAIPSVVRSRSSRRRGRAGGAIAASSGVYLYNWNILLIGQLLWLKEVDSYQAFPPMQDPASDNLSRVLEEINKNGHHNPSE